MKKTFIRTSRSLDKFALRATKTLKLPVWQGVDSKADSLLFFGMYNERDYEVFDNYPGKKFVLWGGSDIRMLVTDYERQRMIKNNPAKHFCENEVEAKDLRKCGIEPIIVPTFLDDISKYEVSFKPSENPELFMCVNAGREEEYGIHFVKGIANKVPFAKFHIYGIPEDAIFFKTAVQAVKNEDGTLCDKDAPNMIYHGKLPEQEFNKELSKYHAGLRPNLHDGASEVMMKSLLLGQYPITRIEYDGIWNYKEEEELISLIHKLTHMKEPNVRVREEWIKKLNNFKL
jgi:hypothetical protein